MSRVRRNQERLEIQEELKIHEELYIRETISYLIQNRYGRGGASTNESCNENLLDESPPNFELAKIHQEANRVKLMSKK